MAGVEKILGSLYEIFNNFLASWAEELPVKQWNRFYIVFDEEAISLNIQLGEFRNVPKIISVFDSDVQRYFPLTLVVKWASRPTRKARCTSTASR